MTVLRLFVSSLSGRGRAAARAPQVAQILRERGWEVTVQVTGRDDDPTALAASCEEQWLGVVGGDGYIADMAAGAASRGAVVIPFPGGRGNDLCRSLGIGTDAHTRARALPRAEELPEASARIRGLDAIRVRDASGEHLVLGLVSFGLDACANQLANESRLSWGALTYAWGAVRALVRFRPQTLRVRMDEAQPGTGGEHPGMGEERELRGWLVSLSNSGWFGGGINIVPSSDPMDGQLELLHVEDVPLRRALRVLVKVLLMRSVDDPIVHVRPVRRLEVRAPEGIVAMGDGDEVARVPVSMELVPAAFTMLV